MDNRWSIRLLCCFTILFLLLSKYPAASNGVKPNSLGPGLASRERSRPVSTTGAPLGDSLLNSGLAQTQSELSMKKEADEYLEAYIEQGKKWASEGSKLETLYHTVLIDYPDTKFEAAPNFIGAQDRGNPNIKEAFLDYNAQTVPKEETKEKEEENEMNKSDLMLLKKY